MSSGVRYRVHGGLPLNGTAFVQGAKNAALPMIAASLLARRGQTVLHNVPLISDVHRAVDLARAVGARVDFHEAERVLVIDASKVDNPALPGDIAGRFRGSVLFLPALLHRLGEAVLEGLGGCNLGSRNLDFHYRGLARLGATVTEGDARIHLRGGRLRSANLYLDTPSHTGTENLIAAACLVPGVTVIENAALEPEVGDFATFLSQMGARIAGVGSGFVQVEGVDELTAVEYTIMPDRIDAGVLAMAVAAAGGEVALVGAVPEHLGVARWKLEQMGVELHSDGAVLHVRRGRPLRPINVITCPYPGFATDLQPPMMALACLAEGTSYIHEQIFDGRFALAAELCRMGATVRVSGQNAVVDGPVELHGAEVTAHDLRAGAALVVAGLAAEGETVIAQGEMIERGHSRLDQRLAALGAGLAREG